MYLIVTLLSFLVLAQANSYFQGSEQPDFITITSEQPKNGAFEVRNYSAANWVSVNHTGRETRSSKMFMNLFGYISGNNQERSKIAMTVPVTTKFTLPPCIFCSQTYVMSFYLPSAFQNSPPTPTNPNVYIEERRPMKVYVRTFGGFANHDDYKVNAEKLYNDLLRNGITEQMIVSDSFYGASYNGPSRFFGRRNEVWIVASQ